MVVTDRLRTVCWRCRLAWLCNAKPNYYDCKGYEQQETFWLTGKEDGVLEPLEDKYDTTEVAALLCSSGLCCTELQGPEFLKRLPAFFGGM